MTHDSETGLELFAKCAVCPLRKVSIKRMAVRLAVRENLPERPDVPYWLRLPDYPLLTDRIG